MTPDPSEIAAHLRRLVGAPFAVLATHGPEGRLDLVPCCFAVIEPAATAEFASGDEADHELQIVTAVDHKPKRHQRLARLANIARDPNVTLLVDHRDPDDWSQLWWVRVHGRAEVVTEGPHHRRAVDALVAKYRQYRASPPSGPAIRIIPNRWAGWAG